MLRKGVYPYEYMDNWERFNETSLPSKESFYSNLNMENIEDIDYRHGNNVFNKFKLNYLGDYHDLYVQSHTLLLADVFENFRDMCLKEYELDPAHFLSLSGLAWQARLKKTNIELELLTDYDMLLMVEEGIRGGICHSIHRYAKANNKYMQNYNNNEESSYIQYLDANNLYGWEMSKKLPVNGFKWIDNNETAEPVLNEDFIKNYDENNDKGYILEVPNYHTINLISEDLSIIETKKTKVKMNKPIYLGLSILEISKTLMYEFWYDCVKPKYNGNVKLCYMDTDSFTRNIKTNDFYIDIANDVENRFGTSNYEVNRPLPKGKNKKNHWFNER